MTFAYGVACSECGRDQSVSNIMHWISLENETEAKWLCDRCLDLIRKKEEENDH